jgi:hypothetical protein
MQENVRKALVRFARPTAALIVLVLVFSAALRASDGDRRLLLAQRDEVQAFDVTTGLGYQTGTASGLVAGTSFVDFRFTIIGGPGPDGALPITFDNKVIITDLDGDQVFFDNKGTGFFHAGIPGDAFRGTGGPLSGTYVVTGGTGKFAKWKVGSTFAYRAIATNPPKADALGTVYVQVTFVDSDNE